MLLLGWPYWNWRQPTKNRILYGGTSLSRVKPNGAADGDGFAPGETYVFLSPNGLPSNRKSRQHCAIRDQSLYELFTEVLCELYAQQYPIERHTLGWALMETDTRCPRFRNGCALIFEAFCIAAIVFMIRFLVALVRDRKPRTLRCVIHMTLQ